MGEAARAAKLHKHILQKLETLRRYTVQMSDNDLALMLDVPTSDVLRGEYIGQLRSMPSVLRFEEGFDFLIADPETVSITYMLLCQGSHEKQPTTLGSCTIPAADVVTHHYGAEINTLLQDHLIAGGITIKVRLQLRYLAEATNNPTAAPHRWRHSCARDYVRSSLLEAEAAHHGEDMPSITDSDNATQAACCGSAFSSCCFCFLFSKPRRGEPSGTVTEYSI